VPAASVEGGEDDEFQFTRFDDVWWVSSEILRRR